MRKNGYLPLERALNKINQTLKVQYIDANLVDLIHEKKVEVVFQVDGYVAEIIASPNFEPTQDKSIRRFYRLNDTYMLPDDIHREEIKSLIDGVLTQTTITNAYIKIENKRKKSLTHQEYVLFNDCDEEKINDFFIEKVTENETKELFYTVSFLGKFKLLPLHIAILEQNGCTLGIPVTKHQLRITEASLKKFLKTTPSNNDKRIETLTRENEKLLKIIGTMNATIKAKPHHHKLRQKDFIEFAKNNLIDDVQISGSMAKIFGEAKVEIEKYLLPKK